MPELLEPPGEDVMAYVALPGLDIALQHVCDLMGRIAPPNTPPQTPATMKSQLGTLLGDPQLAAVDASRPIVVAVLKPSQPGPIPPIVGLVPVKDATKLTEQLAQFGLVGKATGGLLALAQTPQALELTLKVLPLHDRFAATKLAATGRIYADAEALLGTYGALLEVGLLQMSRTLNAMQSPAGAQAPVSAARMLKLQARILLALLGQVDAFQLDLELGRDWMGVHAATKAKPGSELAALFERSAVLKAPRQSLIESRKGIVMAMAMDAGTSGALYRKVLDVLAADPETKDFAGPDLLAAVAGMQESWDGSGTMSIAAVDAKMFLSYEMGVNSEEKFLAMLEAGMKLFSAGGTLGSFYKDMGIEIKPNLQKSARTHGGASIHALSLQSEMSKDADPVLQASAEQLKSLLRQTSEFAVVANRGLVSSSPADLDRMIDAALAKKDGTQLTLKAHEAFGEGRQAYVDYDLASLIELASAGIPAGEPRETFQRIVARLGTVPPVVGAFTADGTRGLVQLRLPVDLFVGIRDAAETGR